MSYITWHNYGIGINTDKIITTADKLKSFIALNPDFEQEIKTTLANLNPDNPNIYAEISVDDLLELIHDMDEFYELASIMTNIIYAKENIRLVACDDFNGVKFCILPAFYPWEMTEPEKALTEESTKKLFEKYIKYLTDQSLEELEYGEQSVENGG